MAIAQKILHARYFYPLIFKYCHEAVKKFPPCQLFYPKKSTHRAPLHPDIAVVPFTKWGIDFMHCKPTSTGGHGYIIVAIDYFTKWTEEIPTYVEDGKTTALFLFDHLIARSGVLQDTVTNRVSHFHNQMMADLSAKLGSHHEK